MAADSKAGLYSNSAAPSRQGTEHRSGVLFPDAGSGIPLHEMISPAVEPPRQNVTAIAADAQVDESTTAAAGDNFRAMRRADTESRGDQRKGSMQPDYLRASSKKSVFLFIMFTLQAGFYVFFAVTLAGAGSDFLAGIPALFSLVGSAVAVITVITNFGIQVKEGRNFKRS